MGHELHWEPGNYGKGLVLPDGSIHTWSIDGANGGPHHADHLGEDMSYTPRVQRECHAFEITPDGDITFSPLTTEKYDYVESIDDRLHHNQGHFMLARNDYSEHDLMDNDFQHRLRAAITQGYQPGSFGKGIIDQDGQLHSWNVGDYYDGLPSHHDVEKHLGTEAKVYFGMDERGQPTMMNAGYDRVTNRELPFAELAPHYTTAHKFLEQFKKPGEKFDLARVAGMTDPQRMRLLNAEDHMRPDQSEVVHQFDNGWSIRKLKTVGDKSREGRLMNNCWAKPVRSMGGEPFAPDAPLTAYWNHVLGRPDHHQEHSLRDHNNYPRASFYVSGGLVTNGLGHGNAQLKPEYRQMISDWAKVNGLPSDIYPVMSTSRVASRERWLKAWDDTIDRPHRFKETEMVPIEALKPFKEWSRDIDRSEYTKDLRDHIAEHGVTGTTFLDYNPDTGHGHISEGNHRLEIADQLGITHLPVTVYRSQRKPREGQWEGHPLPQQVEPDQFGYVPQYIRPSEVGLPSQPVHTAASAFTTEIPGPFAVQLTEFLDQVGREQAHKEGPTPHHDNVDEFIQEPGILARIRNRFQSKGILCPGCESVISELPCQLCGYSDQPSFEQQERDWYNSDPQGAPTKWPFQSEPWRTEHHAPTIGLASLQKGSQSVSQHASNEEQTEAKATSDVSPAMHSQRFRRRREPESNHGLGRRDMGVPNVQGSAVVFDGSSNGSYTQHERAHQARQASRRIRTVRVGNHPPEVVWHGAEHGMQGDHSFFYDRESNKVHIGSPELHHADLKQLTGHHDIDHQDPNYLRYAIGSISGTNVNMDEGYKEDRARITQALGLPEPTDDWRFGQVNR